MENHLSIRRSAIEQAQPGIPDDWTQLVLDAYTTAIRRSRNARGAFDAAVRTYRSHNPGVPEPEARRFVANMICRKPQ